VDYLPEDPPWIPDAFEMAYQAWKDKLDFDPVDRRSEYPRLAIDALARALQRPPTANVAGGMIQ
jgi:hypothetical protein